VDAKPAIALVKPYFPVFVDVYRQAFSEFDTWIPGADRITVEQARPKLMHCRVMHLLELRFGRIGSPRMARHNGLSYLVIDGRNDTVGIRPKKLGTRFKSFNHHSGQQDELREKGVFLWDDPQAHHLFVGYRIHPGLQPSLATIALTFENENGPVWKHVIWTSEQGLNPLQEVSPLLFPPSEELPPKPKVRPRRSKDSPKRDKEGAG
jgi:hypothetical protein